LRPNRNGVLKFHIFSNQLKLWFNVWAPCKTVIFVSLGKLNHLNQLSWAPFSSGVEQKNVSEKLHTGWPKTVNRPSVFSSYRTGNLMGISKMCLKQSFSYFKWVLQAILSLTVLSNCVSDTSNFDTAFLPDCTNISSVFSSYRIVNLMGIPKLCLKQSFSYSKWVF